MKKYGYGGKFMVDGLYWEEDYVNFVFVVMDKNDFNYVDFEEEEVDNDVGVFVSDIVKDVDISVGVVYLVVWFFSFVNFLVFLYECNCCW